MMDTGTSAARSPILAAADAFTSHYFTSTARTFGATPLGVDWTCVATQQMRFVQLLKILDPCPFFTLTDIGCGYGALLDYLATQDSIGLFDYSGIDLSSEMIKLAKRRHPDRQGSFSVGSTVGLPRDYIVASGIFNVRSSQPLSNWEHVIEDTLGHMAAMSRKGFSVNFVLGSHAASKSGEQRSGGLYTTLPERWINYCARRLDCTVDLITDYGLAEFTMLVRPCVS